jgi:hypothetical protein
MPSLLEKLELEHSEMIQVMGSSEFYRKNPDDIKRAQSELQALEEKIKLTYDRWEELESMASLTQ